MAIIIVAAFSCYLLIKMNVDHEKLSAKYSVNLLNVSFDEAMS